MVSMKTVSSIFRCDITATKMHFLCIDLDKLHKNTTKDKVHSNNVLGDNELQRCKKIKYARLEFQFL